MVRTGTLVRLGVVVVTVLGLWVGARLLVDAVVRLARRAGLPELTIGMTVVAMGTSTPELVVTADAAVAGLGDIAVGNVLGSNVYNVAVVLGVVAVVRAVPVAASLVRRDGVALLAATLVGGLALLDLAVTRVEGGVLVALFVAYTAAVLVAALANHPGRESVAPDADPGTGNADSGAGDPVTRAVTGRLSVPGRDVALLVAGLAVVLASGHYLVEAASALARGGGVSEWVVGGTVVAAGTSTPEFAVSLVALRRGSVGVSVGNVVGSNVFNLVGVMGLATVLRPLSVSGAALETLGWLVGVTVVVVAALWTGRVLSRPEGALLVGSEAVRWTLSLVGVLG